MAGGWSRDGAVQEQIDASVADAVERARSALTPGAGRTHCAECGEAIPEARQRAVPGVSRCVVCQEAKDAARPHGGPINRRGSKDSQLR